MKNVLIVFMILLGLSFMSCTENYSNGERVGFITKFSHKGLIWKSWEGQLNLTQTGMNTSGTPFDFSVDNDYEPAGLVATIDSAATLGWKVKLRYHEVAGWNWFGNRGHTDFFVSQCEVLEKNPNAFMQQPTQSQPVSKKDTVWVKVDTMFYDPKPELK